MKLKAFFATVATTAVLTLSATLVAQVDVGHRHPNLRAAQELIEKAISRVSDAQGANEYDMGGHAAKAKSLLDQADAEIKMAAETANRR